VFLIIVCCLGVAMGLKLDPFGAGN